MNESHAGCISESFVDEGFTAECECGWEGTPQKTAALAGEELQRHFEGEAANAD